MARPSRGRTGSWSHVRQCSPPNFPWLAFGLVVSVVVSHSSRCPLRVATRFSSARNRVCRRPSPLLDGGRFPPTLPSRATSGLLFDEHVGWFRHFRRERLGTDAAPEPDRRHRRSSHRRPDRRHYRLAVTLHSPPGRRTVERHRRTVH